MDPPLVPSVERSPQDTTYPRHGEGFGNALEERSLAPDHFLEGYEASKWEL